MKLWKAYWLVFAAMALMPHAQCQGGSFWDLAGSVIQTFQKSSNDYDNSFEFDAIAGHLQSVLNSSDEVIELGLPDFSSIGWKDVFQVGTQLGQTVMDAIDNGALEGVLPDLSSYGFDINYVKSHLDTWNWEKFTDDLIGLMDDQSTETDFYTSEIDQMAESIRSRNLFDDSQNEEMDLPPECFMTVPQMLRFAGYPCSTYTTVTKDGYKLSMHRIPFGSISSEQENGRIHSFEDSGRRRSKTRRTRRGRAKRPVVFLQHGILSDSSCWVSNGPKRSLAFVLADAGFDVWMGNVRGNTYSRDHVNLNPDTDERFWRFSWQQMSEYDLPAMVDAALKVTGQPSLYYIGHSQGTLIAFAHLAEDPSFNDKIKMMFGLAPVATLSHIKSPVKWFSRLTDIAQVGVTMFGGAEILPSASISKWLTAKLNKLSKDDPISYHGSNLLLFLAGFNVKHYHEDRLPVFLSQTPSGTSLHNLIHMSQLVSSGRTQKWNFGSAEDNIKAYGRPNPPEYDVGKIRTPIALFVGSKDDLAVPRDGRMLASNLNSMAHFRMIKGWDHLDFLWGKEAPTILYPDIIGFIHGSETEKNKNSEQKIGFRHIRGVDDEL